MLDDRGSEITEVKRDYWAGLQEVFQGMQQSANDVNFEALFLITSM